MHAFGSGEMQEPCTPVGPMSLDPTSADQSAVILSLIQFNSYLHSIYIVSGVTSGQVLSQLSVLNYIRGYIRGCAYCFVCVCVMEIEPRAFPLNYIPLIPTHTATITTTTFSSN